MFMNRVIGTLAWVLLLLSPAIAADPIVGTWRLQSFVREVAATGQRYNEFGEHPDGYISYLPDGRMHAILVTNSRPKPAGLVPADNEKIELFGTMIAYAGTYKVEGEKVVHNVEISWNQSWTGTQQIRFFQLEGDKLTIATAVAKSPRDGREGRTVVIFEKVR
jgi:Lipocalin-like domain